MELNIFLEKMKKTVKLPEKTYPVIAQGNRVYYQNICCNE